MDNKNVLSDREIKVVLWIITTLFIAFMGIQLDITIVVDEPGTLANAAWMAGDDWNTCVQGIGGYYYKYGSALFFYPLYMLFKDSYVFYKAIMVLHSALLGFIPVIAYDIMRRFLKVDDRLMAGTIATTLGVLPSVVLYSLYARADALLIFLPWLICLLLLEGNKACTLKQRKKVLLTTILMTTATYYGYACHTRGIVLVIALLCVVLFGELFCKIKIVNWPVYIISNVVLYFADKKITQYFRTSIWYGMNKLHATAENFDHERLEEIKTFYGFKSLIKLLVGWAFNMVTSTYGLIIIGVVVTLIIVVCAFRKKTRDRFTTEEKIVSAFGILNFLGAYAMGCLFFYLPASRIFKCNLHGRLDRVIYGRYMAGALGIIVLMALYILMFKSNLIKKKTRVFCVAIHFAVLVIFFGIVLKYIMDGSVASRYFMEIATFLELPAQGATTGDFDGLKDALLAAGVLGILISIIVLAFSVEKKWYKQLLCGMLLGLTTLITYDNFVDIRLSRDVFLENRITMVKDFVYELGNLYTEYPIIYIDNSASTIGTYQLPLREYNLVNRKVTGAKEHDNMLIISWVGKVSESLNEGDIYMIEGFSYNDAKEAVYVKGEDLKKELEERGFILYQYESTTMVQ